MITFRLFRQIAGFLRTNLIIFLHLVMIRLGQSLVGWWIRWSPRREIVENWAMVDFHYEMFLSFISIIERIEFSKKGKIPVFINDQFNKALIKNFGFRNNLKHYIKEASGEDIFLGVSMF